MKTLLYSPDCFDGFVPRVFCVTLLVTCLSFSYWQCAFYHGQGFITRIFLAVMFVQKSPLNVYTNSTQQATLFPTSHSTSIPSISPSFTTTTSISSTQVAASTIIWKDCKKLFPNRRRWKQVGPLDLYNWRGNVGGVQLFFEFLMKNMTTLSSQTKCHVHFRGDDGFPEEENHFNHSEEPYCNAIFVVIHGEDKDSEEVAAKTRVNIGNPNAHIIVLGNWWNSTHETYSNETVTSIWLPFASISFAERSAQTPMDLIHRKQNNRTDRKAAIYRQRRCADHRQHFWDVLNAEMKEQINETGIAVSRCNGHLHSGLKIKIPRKPYSDWRYDDNVQLYSRYELSINMEHNINHNGYVTEKLVDGLLSGSLPIYSGSAQVLDFFLPNGFLHLIPGENDEEVAEKAVSLLQDETKLREAQSVPNIISVEKFQKFYTWHPSTWDEFGDHLRRKIWNLLTDTCGLQRFQF